MNPDDDNNDESSKQHAFWSTQPMPHKREDLPEGPIHNPEPNEIRDTPYHMPAGFEWKPVDVNDTQELDDLYQLLSKNYVEDDDALFRFDYSPEFLMWALTPPGYRADFLIGVRSSKTGKLVAFISGVPATIQVNDKELKVVEINFLCVHKKLRSKRLAPVLIKEMTRRANQNDVFQAVYTAGTVLPVPVSSARYYHRSLNPKKLVSVGFSRLPAHGRTTLARMCKIYALPDQPVTKTTLRPMTPDDVAQVHALLTDYLEQFSLKVKYTHEEIAHWFLPRASVMDSFVAVDENDPTKVTDFVSFYHLPSSILSHNDTLYAAYSYYNVATTCTLPELMRDALILAKAKGADVFNALDLMHNTADLMETLKFGIGDGKLQYYLYNWSCPEMQSGQVGLVLL